MRLARRRSAFFFLSLAAAVGLSGEALGQMGTGRSGMSTSGELGNVRAFR